MTHLPTLPSFWPLVGLQLGKHSLPHSTLVPAPLSIPWRWRRRWRRLWWVGDSDFPPSHSISEKVVPNSTTAELGTIWIYSPTPVNWFVLLGFRWDLSLSRVLDSMFSTCRRDPNSHTTPSPQPKNPNPNPRSKAWWRRKGSHRRRGVARQSSHFLLPFNFIPFYFIS